MASKKTEYEQLRDIWYKKLEDSGFVDIEKDEKSFKKHILHAQSKDKNHDTATYRNSKIEYYNMATSFLNDYKFKSHLEKAIWDYHSNGISIEDITDILLRVKLIKTNRTSVWQIISSLRKKMFKKYKVK
jgi:DNA-binding transcriptional regulator YhcF (GntR family)